MSLCVTQTGNIEIKQVTLKRECQTFYEKINLVHLFAAYFTGVLRIPRLTTKSLKKHFVAQFFPGFNLTVLQTILKVT